MASDRLPFSPYPHEINSQGTACAADCPACRWRYELLKERLRGEQIDEAMTDLRLSSLGRLNAVRQILANYKSLTGKEQLQRRKDRSDPSSTVNEAVASTGN